MLRRRGLEIARFVLAIRTVSAVLLACAACAPAADLHDRSTAQHEREAEDHARAADDHRGQFEPQPANPRMGGRSRRRQWRRRNCFAAEGSRIELRSDVCWTSARNPTAAHLAAAEEHARRASAHRAASAALREAEARACVGIAPGDRDMSPFEHPADIASVTPLTLREADSPAKLPWERTVGVVVTFRAVEGMTAEWLQRIIDCHLARNASLGHVVREMPNCPLVPRGVEARVSSTGEGFAVEIRSTDQSVAREVLARAQRLLGAEPHGPARSR